MGIIIYKVQHSIDWTGVRVGGAYSGVVLVSVRRKAIINIMVYQETSSYWQR